MTHFDRHQKQRQFRLDLEREFPDLDLLAWYTQFRELKAAYPDTVLLYRLGDFYETFDDDAKLVADLLDVTLTYNKFANHKRTKAEQRLGPKFDVRPFHDVILGQGALPLETLEARVDAWIARQ